MQFIYFLYTFFYLALLGITVIALYTAVFINGPWSPCWSYYCMWFGTFCMINSLVIHGIVGDIRVFGETFHVKASRKYRYYKEISAPSFEPFHW